jgi:outer membrane protein OmpA-like peptidoglycan-associated protein
MKKFLIFVLLVITATGCFAQAVQWAKQVIGFSSEYTNAGLPLQYNAIQILGKPTRYPAFGGTACAWSPATEDNAAASEWIQVGYESPMQVQQVVIAENFNAGCVVRVDLVDEAGTQHVIYENSAPQTPSVNGRWNYIFTDRTAYKVSSVKVTLNTALLKGYEQIDAIGIADTRDSIKLGINLVKGYTEKSEREDLGDAINSPTDDLAAVISYDNKTLYFTRQNHPENIPPIQNQDAWFSTQDADGKFSPARSVPSPVNNAQNNSVAGITPDGQTLLVLNVYNPDGTMTTGVSLARKEGDSWGFPEKVEIKNFYNKNRYGEYNLSASGKTMLMTIQRDDGFGSKDIHVSFRQDDGIWSEPKNLGATLNTAESETSSFLAADGRTLYYSTNGLPGYGRNDVFVTQRLDDTWEKWSEPQNLGPDLNTPQWDAYYTFTADGSYVYFVSGGRNGSSDIFRKKLPEGARPDPVVIIKGKVLDAKTKLPLAASISYQNLVTNKNLGYANSNRIDGQYSIVLQSGNTYEFLADAANYYPISDNIDLSKLHEFKEITRDLYLVPIEKGLAIRLNNLFFDFNKSDLKKESFAELTRLADFLKNNPAMKIDIAGHTDNVGTDAYNNPLSMKRAQAVLTFLTTRGIAATRLSAKGYGKTKPLQAGDTEEIRKLNRRVEFIITEM